MASEKQNYEGILDRWNLRTAKPSLLASIQSWEMSRIWWIYLCKKIEGWGKKSERKHSFAKSSIILCEFEQKYEILSSNQDYMIERSAIVPQK